MSQHKSKIKKCMTQSTQKQNKTASPEQENGFKQITGKLNRFFSHQILHSGLSFVNEQTTNINIKSEKHLDHQDDLDEKIPPDFNLAQNHFLANQVGLENDIDQIKSIQNMEFCECCARQIQKNKLNLNVELEKLSFLGSGFPSYFVFIKQCVILLFLLLSISGIFNVASNILGSKKCNNSDNSQNSSQQNDVICTESNWVSISSLGSKQDQKQFMEIQGYLNLVSLIGVIFMLQFFRKYQRELEIKCDQEDISANDYTIIVSNIPIEFDAINNDYDEDIMNFFQENSFPDRKIKVEQVTLCYNLQEFTDLYSQKQQLIKQKQQKIALSQNLLKQKKQNDSQYQQCLDDIQNINKQVELQNEKIDNLTNLLIDGKGKELMKKYFSGIAFVSFSMEQDKEDIIEKYQYIGFFERLFTSQQNEQLIYKGNQLKIKQAPNPSDVFWTNMYVSKKEKSRRKRIGFFIETFVLLVCSAIIYSFYYLQQSEADENEKENQLKNQLNNQNQPQNEQSLKLQVLTKGLAVLISIINLILFEILKNIIEYQRHQTRTDNKVEIAKGLSLSRFINSCIISFIICLYIQDGDRKKKLFGQGGLAVNANDFLISNCFVPFLISALNFDYIKLIILRKLEQRKQKQSFLTQQQLNSLFENPEFPIEERYSQILVTMFITGFYAPILPTSIMWSILALILQYWVDKFDLLNRSTVKYNLSITLSIEMTEHLEYFLTIYSVSTLVFFYHINNDSFSTVCIVGAVIGIVHAWLPMQLINEKIFEVEPAEPNTINYQEAQKYFITDYSRENPIYKRQAQKEYVLKMKERIIQKRQDKKSSQKIIEKQQVQIVQPLQFNQRKSFLQIDIPSVVRNIEKDIKFEQVQEPEKQREQIEVPLQAYCYDQQLNYDQILQYQFQQQLIIKPPLNYLQQKIQQNDGLLETE